MLVAEVVLLMELEEQQDLVVEEQVEGLMALMQLLILAAVAETEC
jgi:hypothetical protein